ncbi:MAG: sphingomyelin phosphodiesterase [Deltaproteobacteria bacterium]|nr:sphingomyelin phosphodiesterase [Deltaproteobacteria bacterium]
MNFELAAFNVFLRFRPFFVDGQLPRAERVARWLVDQPFDAVALSEVFDEPSRRLLLARLGTAYPYRTRVVGLEQGGLLRGNGGVMLVARWPIEVEEQRVFEPRSPLEERFVNKGVVYARIRKGGHSIHVFAAHAYARFRPEQVRRRQFELIRDFMRARAIPPDEPVLFAGDLNVHRGCEPDYRAMLEVLDAHHPATEGHDATYDPRDNPLAIGRARLFLDYVLYSRSHRRPLRATNAVLRPSCDAWRALPWRNPLRELSDHYPVVGSFAF